MTIEKLIQLLRNKETDLLFHIAAAQQRGDVEAALRLEGELEETQRALQKLEA